MFDLKWISRMLWGIENIIRPATIEFIGYQKRQMIDNLITSYEDTFRIGGEEKEYIFSIAMYFGMKIYQNSKLIELRKTDIQVKIH